MTWEIILRKRRTDLFPQDLVCYENPLWNVSQQQTSTSVCAVTSDEPLHTKLRDNEGLHALPELGHSVGHAVASMVHQQVQAGG